MTQDEGSVRLTAHVHGQVQGVGFRFTTRTYAMSLDLRGRAENLPNGDVLVVAEGSRASCEALLEWLAGTAKGKVRRPGRVSGVSTQWEPAQGGLKSFAML